MRHRGICERTAALCALLLGACGDNAAAPRSLAIVEPASGTGSKICVPDDTDDAVAGIEITLRVGTSGFADGEEVFLLVDGATTDVVATVEAGLAVFEGLTLPEDLHVLVVASADEAVLTPPLVFFVDSDPPPLTILAPVDRSAIPTADDIDPATGGIQADVELEADVEDDQAATVVVTSIAGVETTFTGAFSARRATVRVTLPPGTTRVTASAGNQCGNVAESEIALAVNGASPQACALELDPLPGTLAGGGLVYPIAIDPDVEPGFQTRVEVHTQIGSEVQLELDGALETSVTAIDDGSGNGLVELTLDLADGTRVLGALCLDPFGTVDRSAVSAILVDTSAPDCAILTPAAGITLIPDPPGGGTRELRIDVAVMGTGDTHGEEVTIDVGGDVGPVTVQGQTASRIVTLAAPDDEIAVVLSGQDHAGNPCTASVDVAYATQGCTLEWVTPAGTVTGDAGAAPGVQADLRVRVGPECMGKLVTLSNCATSGPVTAVADDGGLAEAAFDDVTLCGQAACQTQRQCQASVTRDGPLTTQLSHTVNVDTQPPVMSILPFLPSVACGASLTPADDIDGATAGVQVQLLVIGDAVTKTVDQLPVVDPITVNGNFARVTLALGSNELVAHGTDAGGLSGTSPTCVLRLGTLAIEIASPADGALLGSDDGVANAGQLLVQVCGQVGEPATAIVRVRIDHAQVTDTFATVDPGTGAWCAGVPLGSGPHTLTALADSTSGTSGTAEIAVTVELDPPGPAQAFAVTPLDRRSVEVSFDEPADAQACFVKQSNLAITGDAEWDAIPGDGITAGGGNPGQTVTRVVLAKPGRDWFFAVRCTDAAGNRSALVSTPTPTVLEFTPGLEIAASAVPGYDTSDTFFGEYIVGADLNDDGLKDLAVAAIGVSLVGDPAPAEGAVYVYLARPGGITQATPDYVLVGDVDSLFGSGLTMLDWNHDGIDDLAVGAPFARGFQGEVDIFYGGAAGWTEQAAPVVRSEATASVELFADPASPFFVLATFGLGLDRVDFDGDGRDDLVVGCPARDDFGGGAVVLFAPTSGAPPASVAVPTDLGPATGMVGYGFDFPAFTSPGDRQYGTRVVGLGRLNGDVAEDILVAPAINKAPFESAPGVPASQSHFVFYGRGRPLQTVPFQVLSSSTAAEELIGPADPNNGGYGFWTGSIADVSGDGRRDLVIAHPTSVSGTGTLLVFPGGTSTGPTVGWDVGEELFHIDGRISGSELGSGLAAGGDIDGDLVEDLVVCSSEDAPPPGIGPLPHLFGWFGGEGTTHLDLVQAPEVAPPSAWRRCSQVAWVGDLNGDGLADVVWGDKAGERREAPPPIRPQRIQILY